MRESQTIGDDDHVLVDAVLPPPDIPILSISEVQRALFDATKTVSGMPGEEVKLCGCAVARWRWIWNAPQFTKAPFSSICR